MSKVIDQVVQTLEKLPTEAQYMVLNYVETLTAQFPSQSIVGNPYPLRGTASISLDPSESVFSLPQNSPIA